MPLPTLDVEDTGFSHFRVAALLRTLLLRMAVPKERRSFAVE